MCKKNKADKNNVAVEKKNSILHVVFSNWSSLKPNFSSKHLFPSSNLAWLNYYPRMNDADKFLSGIEKLQDESFDCVSWPFVLEENAEKPSKNKQRESNWEKKANDSIQCHQVMISLRCLGSQGKISFFEAFEQQTEFFFILKSFKINKNLNFFSTF